MNGVTREDVDRMLRDLKLRTRPGGFRGGGLNPGNWWRWLYTGDANAPDEVYAAALDAAGRVVTCWWDCEVQIHESLAGQLGLTSGAAAGGGALWTFTNLEVPKPPDIRSRTPGPSPVTTLQRLAGQRLRDAMKRIDNLPTAQQTKIRMLRRKTIDRIAARLMDGAKHANLRPNLNGAKSVARGSIAGIAIVEAGFSIYCGLKCR